LDPFPDVFRQFIHPVLGSDARACLATLRPAKDHDSEWLRHANIATTPIDDHRKTRPEDSPTFKVNY
jgi:hypothetical protein